MKGRALPVLVQTSCLAKMKNSKWTLVDKLHLPAGIPDLFYPLVSGGSVCITALMKAQLSWCKSSSVSVEFSDGDLHGEGVSYNELFT